VIGKDLSNPVPEWAEVTPRPVPTMDAGLLPLDQPLSPLAHALVAGCLALARQLGQPVPTIKDPAALNGAEGLERMHETRSPLARHQAHDDRMTAPSRRDDEFVRQVRRHLHEAKPSS